MSFEIPSDGLKLESSASSALPLQAFAIGLSDCDIDGMIECIRNGQGIQLSLGSSPVSSFVNHPVTFDHCQLPAGQR